MLPAFRAQCHDRSGSEPMFGNNAMLRSFSSLRIDLGAFENGRPVPPGVNVELHETTTHRMIGIDIPEDFQECKKWMMQLLQDYGRTTGGTRQSCRVLSDPKDRPSLLESSVHDEFPVP
jgi:hypothetical protein